MFLLPFWCVNSLHTGRRGISEVWNSSLKELQRNHSCFSEAGLFFFFLLFAELKLERSVENANICPRQAANTLAIRERVWTTLLYWSTTMAGWQLWFATFLLRMGNCGRFKHKAQEQHDWRASTSLMCAASEPELYFKLKKTKEQTNIGGMSWQCGQLPQD